MSNEDAPVNPLLPVAPTRWERILARRSTHLGLAVAILLVDYLTGKESRFPIFFVLPVMLAGWHCSPRCAYGLAVVQPLARYGFNFFWEQKWDWFESAENCLIRLTLLLIIAYLVTRTARQTRELAQEVRVLEGFLPICCFCKRIRDEEKKWHQLETYISARSEAQFSHTFCKECGEKHYGEFLPKEKG